MGTSIYAQSFTWNALTFSSSDKGLLRIDYEHDGDPVESRTGSDEYPKEVFVVNKKVRVRVSCTEFKITYGLAAATSNGVATVKTKASTSVLTFAALVLIGVRGNQPRGQESETTLEFAHESSDGTTVPLS